MYPKNTLPKYLNCDQCEIAVPLYLIEQRIAPWERYAFYKCLIEGGEITLTCPDCHNKNEEEEYRL